MDVISAALDAPVAAPMPVNIPQPPEIEAPQAIEAKTQKTQAPAEQTKQQAEPPPSMEVVERVIEQINKSLAAYSREMHISIHNKLKRIMVKVMDTQENKVIREIPPEKVLDAFARTLELAGILLDKRS